ncbi:MAG: tryptophan--tRNA ligase [Candidatus Yanofskybacteria bacterium RIFCSPHIGHO2_02_FULL_43_15c]|uniref:Tryptophan--tRNA ligase n=2 Tax=Candidatus Yanofskyibacteriota TaxID=1752733 RepID=A0A1F8ECH6_9BACT|nr:MAG: tryptophan--tRNA ligase [Candidatus Yanofskybacteria bacterium RIFCSPHIGHO2_01_FULL_41_26]OGN12769.1 MAG: tryptophan--tRNA ligase [Candidatus Yanofskybacteria bacterium RIFCSPHIGHO2_02_FULL_43_15c]OGN21468.1 MAG: tryptophan--tRNA ligase [Candidatus Yanofskybacteria bacterium RIFCSPLOWO2_01_FULL_41_34]
MIKVFSGIRPSGKLHLGNYLGAIKNWVELQNEADQVIFMIADYHAITTPYDPKTYQQQIMDVVLDYLAAGVNPDKALLIRQSKVPQHTELAWIFNTISPIGWLDRLPTYKEKQDQIEESANPKAASWKNNMGILDYPVLMAADILIYKSNLIPVGNEQLKHLDVTNEIAKKFNYLFGEIFESTKPHLTEGAHILSLQDPKRKMSKTGDEGIALSDSPDEIIKKIKKAVTDSSKEIIFNTDSKPAVSNLITIYHLLSGQKIKKIEEMYEGKSYVEFKSDLAEVVVEFLKPFQEKYQELQKTPDYTTSVLTKSEEKAKVLANSTLKEVKEKMGLE